VIQLGETNQIAATATAVAVEQILAGIDQKARLMIGV
jgi:hypothetical protein